MTIEILTFGCDPEIFVQNTEGEICSAIGHFGGTKEKPKPIKILGEGFAVQEDNVLVEFNIPPAKDADEFVEYVQKTIDVLSRRALRKGLSFRKESAFSLDPKHLTHPKALVFGCDPDFNAYTGMPNPAPRALDANLRSAGGHIAVGFTIDRRAIPKEAHKNYGQHVIQQLDFLWGIPSLLLDEGEQRKQLYGKAGAFRLKPFGVEYRTLSNFWIFRPDIAKAMLNAAKKHNFMGYSPEMTNVEVGINTNNKEWALWCVKKYPELAWAMEFLK